MGKLLPDVFRGKSVEPEPGKRAGKTTSRT